MDRKVVNSELWLACAGPKAVLPSVGSFVVYFPQGHSEQVAASTSRAVDGHVPNYTNLQSQLVCQLHSLTLHADMETDEVFAQMTLQPVIDQEKLLRLTPANLVSDSGSLLQDLDGHRQQAAEFFCKILTASDTSTHGGFSIPRRAAEKVFPSLDFTKQPPAQELQARDLHDNVWTFRHIYRGQPKRHLLTTGWSAFVSSKRLVAGDSVLFIRDDKGRLLLGIRRAKSNSIRQQPCLPSSVLSSDSMQIGVLAAAAHAFATSSCFQVLYNPRTSTSEFVIPWSRYRKAIHFTQVSVGMRFRMVFETEESTVRRYMGTVIGIGDLDSVRWPGSKWRSLEVGWDESGAGERPRRVSPWEIDLVSTPFFLFPPYLQQTSLLLRPPPPPAEASLTDAAYPLQSAAVSTGQCDMDEYIKSNSPWIRDRAEMLTSMNRQSMHSPSPPPSSSSSSSLSQAPLPFVTTMAQSTVAMVPSSHHHAFLPHLQQHEQQSYPYPPAGQVLLQQSPVQGHHLQQATALQQITAAQTAETYPRRPPPPQQIFQPAVATSSSSWSTTMQKPDAAGYEIQARALIDRSHAGSYSNIEEDSRISEPLHASMPMQQKIQPPFSQLPPLPKTPPLSYLHQQTVIPQLQPSSWWQSTQLQPATQLPDQDQLQRSMSASLLQEVSSGTPSRIAETQIAAKWLQFPRESSAQWESSSSSSPMQLLPNIQIAHSESLSTVTSVSYSLPLDDATPADSSSLIWPTTTTRFHSSNEAQAEQSTVNNSSNTAIADSFLSSSPAHAPAATASFAPANPDRSIHIHEAAAAMAAPNSRLPEWGARALSQTTSSTPLRTFTKVQKVGSVGRSIDVSRLRSYEELRRELARMFNMEGQLEDEERSYWKLVFVDSDGDILLVGDDPWEEFVSCVRSIRILSAAQVMQMNEEGGWEQQQQHGLLPDEDGLV